MKIKATLAISFLLLLTSLYLLVRPPALRTVATHKSVAAEKPVVSPPTRQELLELVNQERAKNGVAPLTEDSRLDSSAQRKADDEVTYDYFGHISPHDGLHGYAYIAATGISCSVSSENITENTVVNDSKHAVAAWMLSPPHHAAMVNPAYSLTGFGISGNQIVEHFCQTS